MLELISVVYHVVMCWSGYFIIIGIIVPKIGECKMEDIWFHFSFNCFTFQFILLYIPISYIYMMFHFFQSLKVAENAKSLHLLGMPFSVLMEKIEEEVNYFLFFSFVNSHNNKKYTNLKWLYKIAWEIG